MHIRRSNFIHFSMSHKNIFLSLTYLLLCACSGKVTQQQAIVIDLMDAQDSIPYSVFVDSIETIPLETTDSCLIGYIQDIAATDDRFFILDQKQQTVWVFDRQGNFINRIGKRGNGPGEYVRISQIEYDKRKQMIVLLVWNRLMYYTPDGRYIKSEELPMGAADFKLLPDRSLILSRSGETGDDAGIYYVDSTRTVYRHLISRKPNHRVPMNTHWELYSYEDTVCFMSPLFDNFVYHYYGDSCTLAYPFVMKPDLHRDYKQTDEVSLQYFEDFIRTVYVENRNWIIASYWSAKHDLRIMLFDKKGKNVFIGKEMTNDVNYRDWGGWTSACEHNQLVTFDDSNDSDENPTIQILHLK